MRSFIAVVGMAAAVAAQTPGFHAINLPGMFEDVPACSTYMIKWTPSTDAAFAGPVTFGLIGGATQQTLVPIGSNFGSALGSVGEYAWSVPCDAGTDAIYGLKIFLASNLNTFQYSMPFHIVANGGTTTSASASASEPASSTAKTTTPHAITGHDSYNSTMTTMTTMASPVPTNPTNGTITTHKPSGASVTVTSFTTEAGNTGAGSTGTGAAATTAATAGASRALSSSFAILAVAAAFFSL